VSGGVQALKLYFMMGLPTETQADVDEIADLTVKIYDKFCVKNAKVGSLTLSVNAFSPKPWTPLQWEPMEEMTSLRTKLTGLKKRLSRLPRVTVDTESPREAYYQTLLSRGDRRTSQILLETHHNGGDWWSVLQRLRRTARPQANDPRLQGRGKALQPSAYGLHPDFFVHRRYDDNEVLPWDFIDHSVSKSYLLAEWRKAHLERQTPPCDVTTCHNCKAC
jgi:hypothetical protein